MNKQELKFNQLSRKTARAIVLEPHQLLEVSKELLALGHKVSFCAVGRSMEPTIMDGDTVIISKVSEGRLRRGEIVLIKTDLGRPIIHRLISLRSMGNKNLVQTCGDNASVKDKPVEKQQVLGRIDEIQRGGKRVDSSRFLNRMRALWYLLRAQRIPIFIEKENERDEQFSQDL
ncbi:MAG: signal peptidase I [Anaerolineaceae bacterium]|jgi:hypothetical protein